MIGCTATTPATAPTSSTCQTGCPYCGCVSPGCEVIFIPNQMFFVSNGNSMFSFTEDGIGRLDSWDMPVLEFKFIGVEPWQQELLQTPRRMKRPFPANKPAPHRAQRRACY